MTEREKMLAGEMYDPFDPELVAGRARARDLCQALNATREAEAGERRQIPRDPICTPGRMIAPPPTHTSDPISTGFPNSSRRRCSALKGCIGV